MISHRLLSGVLSKSSPTSPFGGVPVLVGVEEVLLVVEEGLVVEEDDLLMVVGAVPGRHCD